MIPGWLGAGWRGRGRGEWLRPPLAPGSRPSAGSQSGSLGPRRNGPARPPLRAPRLLPSPGPGPCGARALPARRAPPPHPVRGEREAAWARRGSPRPTRGAPSAAAELPRPLPPSPTARAPGAEFTYSRSSPGSHFLGEFSQPPHAEKRPTLFWYIRPTPALPSPCLPPRPRSPPAAAEPRAPRGLLRSPCRIGETVTKSAP